LQAQPSGYSSGGSSSGAAKRQRVSGDGVGDTGSSAGSPAGGVSSGGLGASSAAATAATAAAAAAAGPDGARHTGHGKADPLDYKSAPGLASRAGLDCPALPGLPSRQGTDASADFLLATAPQLGVERSSRSDAGGEAEGGVGGETGPWGALGGARALSAGTGSPRARGSGSGAGSASDADSAASDGEEEEMSCEAVVARFERAAAAVAPLIRRGAAGGRGAEGGAGRRELVGAAPARLDQGADWPPKGEISRRGRPLKGRGGAMNVAPVGRREKGRGGVWAGRQLARHAPALCPLPPPFTPSTRPGWSQATPTASSALSCAN
jgi:hypothetical protein